MYGPLTTCILLLMLLHSSMNNQHHLSVNSPFKQGEYPCKNDSIGNNSTQKAYKCDSSSENRLEIRKLSSLQVNALVNTLEKVLAPIQDFASEPINSTLGCGLAKYLDLLLLRDNLTEFLMPYWDYRRELNMPRPEESSIYKIINQTRTSNFSKIIQGLAKSLLIESEKTLIQQINIPIDEAYQLLQGENISPKWGLSQKDQRLSEMDKLSTLLKDSTHHGGFLQLLLLVTIDMDTRNTTECSLQSQLYDQSNHTQLDVSDCKLDAKEPKWNGMQLKYTSKTTGSPRSRQTSEASTGEDVLQTSTITAELNSSTEETANLVHYLMKSPLVPEKQYLENGTTSENYNFFTEPRNTSQTSIVGHNKKHRKHSKKSEKRKEEMTTTRIIPTRRGDVELMKSKTNSRKNLTEGNYKEGYTNKNVNGKKRGKKRRKMIETTLEPTRDSSPNMSPNTQMDIPEDKDNNHLAEDGSLNENNNLDLLLPYVSKPKPPKGTILWNSKKTPFPLVYFTINIIDGPLSKGRRPPSYRKRRSHGARIYLMGLNMPTGYNQITEGSMIKASNVALVRTVNPQTTGPFVEFKIRVENKYGSSCKQMCLEPINQRYKRCARRTVRLSTYSKFSDPIQYYETPSDAIDGQWTGRGYYKKRKFDYLLFRCD